MLGLKIKGNGQNISYFIKEAVFDAGSRSQLSVVLVLLCSTLNWTY